MADVYRRSRFFPLEGLLMMDFLRKTFTPLEYLVFGILVIAILFGVARFNRAQAQSCMPADIATVMIEARAHAIGVTVEAISDPGEVARYLAVFNEEPPIAEADRILFAPVSINRVGVWFFRDGMQCDAFDLSLEFHSRALIAAKGQGV